jgi:hypothetical protein
MLILFFPFYVGVSVLNLAGMAGYPAKLVSKDFFWKKNKE